MKIYKTLLLVLLFFLFFAVHSWAAKVQNTIARQTGNQAKFTYDLIGEEKQAQVNITIIVQGKTYKASDLHLEGDFGKVATGNQKTIYWNVLQDFPRGLKSAVTWEITAGNKEYTSSVTGAEFVFINPGSFMMGSPSSEPERASDEKVSG